MRVIFDKAVMSDGINPRKAQAAFLAIRGPRGWTKPPHILWG